MDRLKTDLRFKDLHCLCFTQAIKAHTGSHKQNFKHHLFFTFYMIFSSLSLATTRTNLFARQGLLQVKFPGATANKKPKTELRLIVFIKYVSLFVREILLPMTGYLFTGTTPYFVMTLHIFNKTLQSSHTRRTAYNATM